jgi:hypothetical protein
MVANEQVEYRIFSTHIVKNIKSLFSIPFTYTMNRIN